MQIKALVIATLAATSSAAAVEKRQGNPLSGIPSEILTNLPPEVTALLPFVTAIPSSIFSEVESAILTLNPTAFPAFFSSILQQLPPGLVSSLEALAPEITSDLAGLTSLISGPATAAPTVTSSGATETGAATTSAPTSAATGASTGSSPSDTSAPSGTTSASGSSSTGSSAPSGTSSAPSASGTPNSGSKTFVGLSALGLAGILGAALAL